MNFYNICENSSNISDVDAETECKDVSKGILEKGLRTAIVSLTEDTRDILSRYRTTKN